MLQSGMIPKPFPGSNRDQRLCWIGRHTFGPIYFGEPTVPFQILVTEEHFAWLSAQCEEMDVPKEDLILNALREWVNQPGREKVPDVGFSWLVFVALEDFIRRHHSKFLRVT
jgi:hypothetical protein